MKNEKTAIVIILLASITIFSAYKGIASQIEKNKLQDALTKTQAQSDLLKKEKQDLELSLIKAKESQEALSQENVALKDQIRESQDKVSRLEADLNQSQAKVNEMTQNMDALKSENTTLIDEKNRLNTQVSTLTQENANLNARLGSLDELKKAIRELKHKVRTVFTQVVKKEPPTITDGNRGYLLKEGKPTKISPKVKIDIIPLQTNP